MRVEKAIKKIEKALGVKVQSDESKSNNPYYNSYWFEYENNVCSFRTQQAYGEDENGDYGPLDYADAMSWHIRSRNDHTDLMTDYFAGYFVSNCTQLIRACKPPEAKFPVGTLVRGKQNKRATRQGYAGKIGLVMKAGQYMSIDWIGEPKPEYPMTYPQRDIELVSKVAA